MIDVKKYFPQTLCDKPDEFLKMSAFFAKIVGYFILCFWILHSFLADLAKGNSSFSDTIIAAVTLLLFIGLHVSTKD